MARAGIPWAAAAAVTSGSLAAPSNIEYSVWTCRCANESDGLLTGGRAPQWSCVPGRHGLRRATGGEDRRASPRERCLGVAPILALEVVYAEGLTGRVFSQADRSVTPAPATAAPAAS